MTISKEDFIASIYDAALRVTDSTGLSVQTMLSQAAQETGWGAKILADTNNIFNIKADSSWIGPTKTFVVKEFIGGRYVDMASDFRVYDSFYDSINDGVSFLKQYQRYKDVFITGTLGNFEAEVRALQAAGYAMDPDYADNLIAVYRGRTMQNALVQVAETASSGLYYVSIQVGVIGVALITGYSSAILAAINSEFSSFDEGSIVRIPTGVIDLSIGQDTYLLNGEVGGRAATYFVVMDTDANGGMVRRLVQTGAKGPAEAGRVTFLDAAGHEISSFPTVEGEGGISLNADGEVQYRVPAAGAGETMTYRQISDGSVYASDDLGNWAVYKSAEQAATDGDNVVVRAGDSTGRLFIRTADGGALWDGSEKRGDLIDWQDGYKDVRVEMAEGYYLLRVVNNGPEIVTSGAAFFQSGRSLGGAIAQYVALKRAEQDQFIQRAA